MDEESQQKLKQKLLRYFELKECRSKLLDQSKELKNQINTVEEHIKKLMTDAKVSKYCLLSGECIEITKKKTEKVATKSEVDELALKFMDPSVHNKYNKAKDDIKQVIYKERLQLKK